MKRIASLSVGLIAITTFTGRGWAADKALTPNAEGFVMNWLVLAPIHLPETERGADGLSVEHVKGQASVAPKAGDKVKVGEDSVTWKAVTADTNSAMDFNVVCGDRLEYVAAYAVTDVKADSETKVKVKIGSNDEGVLWINGKEIIRNTEPRTLESDQNEADVTLTKGWNHIVFKVINDENNWGGKLRFTDKEDKPVTSLQVSLSPEKTVTAEKVEKAEAKEPAKKD